LKAPAGNAAAARDLYTTLLPILKHVFAPEPPSTLTARDKLVYSREQAEAEGLH
jgi:hypothetical protein